MPHLVHCQLLPDGIIWLKTGGKLWYEQGGGVDERLISGEQIEKLAACEVTSCTNNGFHHNEIHISFHIFIMELVWVHADGLENRNSEFAWGSPCFPRLLYTCLD